MKNKNGIISTLLIFILPTITYVPLAYYCGILKMKILLQTLSKPAVLGIIAVVLATAVVLILRAYRGFRRFMAAPDQAELESVQKKLIGFPKKLLIFGLLYGLVLPQLAAFFITAAPPGMRIDFLFLGYANSVFLSIPPYVMFIQIFEKWTGSIPFSTKYMSMKLNVRMNLVSAFVLTSMSCMLAITIKNTITSLTAVNGAFRIIGLRSLPILCLGVFGGILNIYLLMRGVSNRLHRCRDYSREMASGDISMGELETTSRDELGALTAEISHVYRNMNELIGSVKLSVGSTITVKDSVLEVADSIASTVGQITGNLSSVGTKFENLDSHVTGTIQSVGSLNTSIEGLNDEILKQSSMVEESTASITEMIASVDNIARISAQKMEGVGELTKVSAEGSEKLANTVLRLKEIGESIQKINEITGIIQNIAAQTNLLAMNAAIEAAHAGDAGRGFAVVADEIRKLAETSSNNSKHISDSIKSIHETIEEAVVSGDATSESFHEISREITDVSNSFEEIYTGVDELKTGGEHVLQAVNALNDTSMQVKSNSDSMQDETGNVREAMEDLKKLSSETKSLLQEMTAGMQAVSENTGNLNTHTRKLDETTGDVEEQINRFKT